MQEDEHDTATTPPGTPVVVGESAEGRDRVELFQQRWKDKYVNLPHPDWRPRRAADVAAVGYIPHHNSVTRFPERSAFKQLGKAKTTGFTLLFRFTGNPVPPSSFAGEDGLRNFFRDHQFRAAVWLTDVNVYVDDDNQIAGMTANRSWKCGYTPYPSVRPRPGPGRGVIRPYEYQP